MKKTFTTTMPDKVGSFLWATEIISELGLNITRVSYNKAVDTHTLFIEVDGEQNQLDVLAHKLAQNGFLGSDKNFGKVVLIEFKLADKAGTLLPVLQLISEYNFNISYISSQASDLPYQNFRMGLFVDSGKDISQFLQRASTYCGVKIIDYDSTEKVLDNTVFYLNFANDIATKLNLTDAQKNKLIIYANLIMELGAKTTRQTQKTFDYISRFADFMAEFSGVNFNPRITCPLRANGLEIVVIEPPCGSNTVIIKTEQGYVCIDGGFARYKTETMRLITQLFDDFDTNEKVLLLTHSDVDHLGLWEFFNKIYLSQNSLENFVSESQTGKGNREVNPLHAPYVKISKILSDYKTPSLDKMVTITPKSINLEKPLTHCGTLDVQGLQFEVYEGQGGHTKGETIFIDRKNKFVITGDLFVNLKDYTKEQATFNKLAPYLMTSVDTDAEKAKIARESIFSLLSYGEWVIIPGHGACKTVKVE